MEVKVLQTDMTEEMQDSVCDFIIEGFKKKIEYEDIAKYIKIKQVKIIKKIINKIILI